MRCAQLCIQGVYTAGRATVLRALHPGSVPQGSVHHWEAHSAVSCTSTGSCKVQRAVPLASVHWELYSSKSSSPRVCTLGGYSSEGYTSRVCTPLRPLIVHVFTVVVHSADTPLMD